MRKFLSILIRILGAAGLALIILGGVWLLLAGSWFNHQDKPEKCDAIVVLGGSFCRPYYAGELYTAGMAPKVMVSRPIRSTHDLLMEKIGIAVPPQEEVYSLILRKTGVPDQAISLFGRDLESTKDEAETLAGIIPPGSSLLIVTSPAHVRRCRIIFRDHLPGRKLVVVGNPYEPLAEKWWTERDSAREVILESAKILFYYLGGTFERQGAEQRAAGAKTF